MSEHEHDDSLIRSTFAAELTPGDGRTVDCRIVPYGERIEHNDGLGGLPEGDALHRGVGGRRLHAPAEGREPRARERRAPGGARAGSSATASRSLERHDGLYGSFKIHENAGRRQGADARQGGRPGHGLAGGHGRRRRSRPREGVVRRVKAHLEAVAFARFGAYPSATVLAVRERATFDEELPEELLPAEMDPETGRALSPARARVARALPGAPRRNGHPRMRRAPPRSAPARPGQATTLRRNDGRNTERAQARPPDRRARDGHAAARGAARRRREARREGDDRRRSGRRSPPTASGPRISTRRSPTLAETVEGNNTRDRAVEEDPPRPGSGNTDGIDEDGDGVVYRTMAAYARDVILTGNGREAAKIKGILGDKQEIERAEQRLQLLKRTPANTLSSDVPGLIPNQHIDQIFQVIDSSRPLVASASADDARPGHDQLPEHHRLAGRRRAGGGEDRGREHGHGRRDGDRHRLAPTSAAATSPGRRSTGRPRTRSTSGSGSPGPTTR